MKTKMLMAVAALAFAGTTAMAEDVVYDLGDLVLETSAAGPTPVVIDLQIDANEFGITGFTFEGDYSEDPAGGSWASDTKLVLSGLLDYSIGGFSSPVNDWDALDMDGSFPQGSGSNDDGFYSSTNPVWESAPIDKSAGGTLTLTFTNDWNSDAASTMTWANATLIIHKIPAPGALALLGLAGLAGTRRRRA